MLKHLRPLGILLSAYIIASSVFYFGLTSRIHNAADFFIEWQGSRVAFGLEDIGTHDPYSDAATHLIQLGSKGHLVGADEDQLAFVYPLYRVFYSAPFAPLPFDLAAALWMGLSLVAYGWAVGTLPRLLGWRFARRIGLTLAYWAVAMVAFPSFSALMLGQALLLVVAFLLGGYICIKDGRDATAGVFLALATVKPQLAFVVIPFALGWAIYHRRWRLVLGFGLTLSLLCAASFALMPDWVGAFISGATRYPSYKPTLTAPGFLSRALGIPDIFGWLLWIVVAVSSLWLLWRLRRDVRGQGFDLAFMLAVVLTLWLPPQTNMSNAALLVGPFAFLFAYLLVHRHITFIILIAFGWVVASWMAYSLFYTGRFDSPSYGWLIVIPAGVGLLVLIVPAVITFRSELAYQYDLPAADNIETRSEREEVKTI